MPIQYLGLMCATGFCARTHAQEYVLGQCEIGLCGAKGETFDSEVNDWYENMADLTVVKIARLTAAIKSKG